MLCPQVEKVACSTQTPDSVLQRFSASQRLQSPGSTASGSPGHRGVRDRDREASPSSAPHSTRSSREQSPATSTGTPTPRHASGQGHKRSHNRGHLLAVSSLNNPTPANTPKIPHKERRKSKCPFPPLYGQVRGTT